MSSIVTYFKEAWQELEKVSWPDRKTSVRLTISVITMAGILGIFIAVSDFGLIEILERFILGF